METELKRFVHLSRGPAAERPGKAEQHPLYTKDPAWPDTVQNCSGNRVHQHNYVDLSLPDLAGRTWFHFQAHFAAEKQAGREVRELVIQILQNAPYILYSPYPPDPPSHRRGSYLTFQSPGESRGYGLMFYHRVRRWCKRKQLVSRTPSQLFNQNGTLFPTKPKNKIGS